MRFEVLKRDAEIEYWQAVAGGGDAGSLRAKLQRELRRARRRVRLRRRPAMKAASSWRPDKIARLEQIAERTWLRTLDDRLGLSPRSETREPPHTPAPPLPAVEQLLADKPEHLIARSAADRCAADNPWGFRIQVPPHKRNDRGELYNLCIGRGTLTEEERYKINDHIVQTIMMLSQLPFPKHLQRRAGDCRRAPREDWTAPAIRKRLRAEE